VQNVAYFLLFKDRRKIINRVSAVNGTAYMRALWQEKSRIWMKPGNYSRL
jgi:hypothetical protein